LFKSILPAIILLAGVGLWIGFKTYFLDTKPTPEPSETVQVTLIDWRILRQLDWKTGTKTKTVEDLQGVRVRIPGFVVPLEDEQTLVKEFLFVPTMQACVHVPPPPPNQMIYVMMNEAFELNWGFRAFWLEGILQIAEKKSPYGQVSYQMNGIKLEPYRKY